VRFWLRAQIHEYLLHEIDFSKPEESGEPLKPLRGGGEKQAFQRMLNDEWACRRGDGGIERPRGHRLVVYEPLNSLRICLDS
jgi:hypothetical protein